MKHFYFFFLFIFLSSNVLGFDCSIFPNPNNCNELNLENEDLIANLIYTDYLNPNHDFINLYNSNININSAPSGSTYHYKGIIQSAWFEIFTIQPSIIFNDKLFVPFDITLRSDYDFNIKIPDNYYSNKKRNGRTCKILYSLNNNKETLNIFENNNQVGTTKISSFKINSNSNIKAILEIEATTESKEYKWDKYCCRRNDRGCTRYCYDCDYYRTTYKTDILTIERNQDVFLFNHVPYSKFEIVNSYYGSNKGIFDKDNYTSAILTFNNSYYKEFEYQFNAIFTHKPHYFLQLIAKQQEYTDYKNIIKDNYTFFVKDISECSIESNDFFFTKTFSCEINPETANEDKIEAINFSSSWNLLLKIIIFLFINYILYIAIKKSWGKVLIPITIMIFIVPIVSADDCGLTNLASCIPEKMYDFLIDLLNAPLQPLLWLTRTLLESPPITDIFHGVWAIIVYCISMFYGLLFIYSGFQFIFSGHNVIRREIAKDWLKNTIIMIVLIQASFYLYQLILELGSVLTTSVLSLVDEHFFLITADNIANIGLEFLFISFYVLTLFCTLFCLVIRYLVVAFGIIFAPIGIFCYFIPPIKSYGKLILNILGMLIFITFLDAIIILACSMLIEIPIFENIKILVMICCFSIVNILFLILTKHAISKSSVSDSGEKVAQAVKYIAMFV